MDEIRKKRIDLFAASSTEIKNLYSSESSSSFHSRIISRYNIAEESAYIDVLGDAILGIHPVSDLYTLLTTVVKLSDEMSRDIINDVTDFLSPIKNCEVPNPNTTEIGVPYSAVIANEVIPALRTMAGDVDKVHGYGAYREIYPGAGAVSDGETVHRSAQDDALGKPLLADTPTYSETDKNA